MKLAFEGELHKPKGKEKYWAVGVPILEIYTQGKSKKDALFMIKDAIELAIGKKDFKVKVIPTGDNTFAVTGKNFRVLLGFMLQQKRSSKGLSFRQAAQKLDSESPNAYRRYELGKAGPSIEKLLELMEAVGDEEYLLLKTA